MRPIRALLIVLALASTCGATGFVRLADEAELPWPDNWYLGSDSLAFPFRLIYQNDSAEILIFRSVIGADQAIRNHRELKQAVDLVITDVIDSLPGARLQTSTGFYDTVRAGFVLEFTSLDTISSAIVQHRLAGIVYREPGGGQLLFTLWGKAPTAIFPEVKPAMKMMQEGFAFRGDHEPEVFVGGGRNWWPFVMIGIAVAALVLLRSRRRAGSAPVPRGGTWRCECGRTNVADTPLCRRCDRARPPAIPR